MTASAHERYRAELTRLAADDPFGLGTRRYGRFFPDREPFAVLTYEAAGRVRRVEVFRDRHEISDAADDPALPGLRAALAAGAEIVRYHPGRRCTLRLGDRFAQVAPEPPAVWRAQQELWARRDELGFAVAEPLGLEGDTVWLGAVPGEPAPLAAAGRMGAGLAPLHRSAVRPARRHEPRDAASELIRRVPALRCQVEAML